MPVEAYYSKGILENLVPYLESDPDIKKEDYFDNLLEAMYVNGGLPYVTGSVTIQTIFADSRMAGTEPGWSTETFSALLEKYGPAAFGSVKQEFILKTMVKSSTDFVNWSKRSCNFDSKEFTNLLELSKRFGTGSAAVSDSTIAQFGSAVSCFDINRLHHRRCLRLKRCFFQRLHPCCF